jgi:CRP/FNR family cyclic AMP-dependent transcriptional regulator
LAVKGLQMTAVTQTIPPKGTAIAISRLFENIPDDIRQMTLRAGPSVVLKKGQALFERGDDGGTMYVVQSGRIEISMITETGRKMVFNLIAPGHCIGEIGMLDGHHRTASAIAIEDSSLMPISRSTFFEAVKRCPQLAINMMEILCSRIRWVSDSVEEYALHSLPLRLARRLLVLHRNFGGSGGTINITQNDLADFAGATREATNKVLMQWKNDKLISLGRSRIAVSDLARLELVAFGESDHQ